MKSILLLLASLFIAVILQAQVSKTLEVTAGGLKTALTADELNTITNLTLTGTIDARDFKTMRDDMPNLSSADIHAVTIAEYSGTEGTDYDKNSVFYPRNIVPNYALKSLASLKDLLLPSTITSIGHGAFLRCRNLTNIDLPFSLITIESIAFESCVGLTSMNIPPSVTKIGSYAFCNCDNLSTVTIPSSVTMIEEAAFAIWSDKLKTISIPYSVDSIGYDAFQGSIADINVDVNNSKYSSIDGVLFDKSQTTLIEFPTTRTGRYIIPLTVKAIAALAFHYSSLSSVIIPSSVTKIGTEAFSSSILKSVKFFSSFTEIGSYAFNHCKKLSSITFFSESPPDLTPSKDVFGEVSKSTCILYVPLGSKGLYANSNQWEDFENIVEKSFFEISANALEISTQRTVSKINITSDYAWTASSDQSWVTLQLTSGGKGSDTIIILSAENTSAATRIAKITFMADNGETQCCIITQKGLPKTVTITGGGLAASLTSDELNGITNLTIKGTMDARYFKTIRDEMPLLSEIDLYDVTIAAYSGIGTVFGWLGPSDYDHPANEIPPRSFSNGWSSQDSVLSSIILPASITSIGNYAFLNCYKLTSIDIPPTVTNIEKYAFSGCSGLTSVIIPSSIQSIGEGAFTYCTGLTSFTIPSSVKRIGGAVFYYCNRLYSIIINSINPPLIDQNNWGPVVATHTAKLYVPFGSKPIYSTAIGWEEFTSIEEMPGFMLSSDTVSLKAKQGSSASVNITSNVGWTAKSNQAWLKLNQGSGIGEDTLSFTADTNPTSNTRTATVTVSAEGIESQTISVTQEGGTTALNELAENSTQFKCYPNPFTNEIILEIQNPKRAEITVDIYNLAGEQIKNLATKRKDEKVNLTWNGTNDSGQKVSPGVYICKVNNWSKQLIYQGQKGKN